MANLEYQLWNLFLNERRSEYHSHHAEGRYNGLAQEYLGMTLQEYEVWRIAGQVSDRVKRIWNDTYRAWKERTLRSITAKEMLEKAVRVIESNGWCQGNGMDEQGRVCAIGALTEAEMSYPAVAARTTEYYKAVDALTQAVPEDKRDLGEGNLVGPARYNDLPDTTEEDVLEMFRKAIDSL